MILWKIIRITNDTSGQGDPTGQQRHKRENSLMNFK